MSAVEKAKAKLAKRVQASLAKLKSSWRTYSAPITYSYLLLTVLYVVQAIASSKLYATIIYAIGSFLYLVIAVLHWFAESGVEGELAELTERVAMLETRTGNVPPLESRSPPSDQRYSFAPDSLRSRARNV